MPSKREGEPMPESIAAYRAYKQADEDAQKLLFRARATLGATILRERTRLRRTQDDAAEQLGVVVAQVRRYEQAARQWAKTYPKEPLEG